MRSVASPLQGVAWLRPCPSPREARGPAKESCVVATPLLSRTKPYIVEYFFERSIEMP